MGKKGGSSKKHLYTDALACGKEIKSRLKFNGKTLPIVLVGGLRRKSPLVRDIDLLVIAPKGAEISSILSGYTIEGKGAAMKVADGVSGPRRTSFTVTRSGAKFKIDLFLARREDKPFALFHHTGGAAYNTRIRAHAKKKGWKLNQYGIFYRDKAQRVPGSRNIKTEKELAAFLGVTYHAPKDRNDK
jgi:DNA polymerase (family 10)